MTHVLTFGGDGGQVELHVLGYERPEAAEGPDANWLACEVSASVSGFQARFQASIESGDIADFSATLRALIAGRVESAVLETDEGQIRVRLDLHRTGRAEVEAELASATSRPGGLLKLRFESDQTFISALARSVESTLKAYPVRG